MSSDLEFPETSAYSSTNVVRGGAFQDNHQGKYIFKKLKFFFVKILNTYSKHKF